MPVRSSSTIMKPYPDQEGHNGQKPPDKIDICLKDNPFQLTKPLVISMSLFGLLFFKCKKSKLSSITRAYSLFVLLLLSVAFLQLFFAYRDEHFGKESFIKVVVHLWYLHNCVNALVTYRACNNENRFVEFLLKWSRFLRTNRGISPLETSFNISKYERRVKSRFILFLAIGWIVMIVSITYEFYFLFNTNLIDFAIAPMSPSHSSAVVMKVIVAIVDVYMTAAWIFTMIIFIMMSGVIYLEFEIFHDDLQKAVSPKGDIAELEWFRRRHQDICQMVETADDIWSAFNAAGIFFSTCEAMLLLYTTVTSPAIMADPLVLLAHCFWLTTKIMYLVLISFGGGYLNHMAHAPLKTIHLFRIKDATPEFSLQMTMFLNKLTGQAIGLTALDMFVIDKPTILTIAGAFITYFIVLIQFQPLSNASDCTICNCTRFWVNSTLQCSTNFY